MEMMNKAKGWRAVLVVALTAGCSGCGSIRMDQFSAGTPPLDMIEYFQGRAKGWGVVLDRSGALASQFVVDTEGTLNDEGGLVLDEDFTWHDGEETKRVWTISRGVDGAYSGVAGDVVGTATGRVSGNVLNWTYTMDLELEGKTYRVGFDDWMWLLPDGVLLNRAEIRKFGLRVGTVLISFQKESI